jgi:pimeloyl-ACP methyl ester carboxylesterase
MNTSTDTSAKNPTLVFIPCFSGAPWSAEQLAPYGDVPKRTLRLPEGVDDMERYADYVMDVVADLDDWVLVGDSFGANIALAVATRRPQGLRALVVSGGFATNPITSQPWKAVMQAAGKARGPLYRQATLRAHAHRLTSPFDGEGHDVLIGPDASKVMLAGIPDAREVTLPRTGHMFRFSHPVDYAAAVTDFLAALPAARQAVHA